MAVYNKWLSYAYNSGGPFWNDPSAVFMCVLLTGGAYTFDKDHNWLTDITGYEFNDASYNREAVSNRSITEDDTSDLGKFDADDTTFTALNSGNVSSVAIVHSGSTEGTSALVVHLSGSDFPKPANGGDFTIQYASNGVFTITGVN